jgi:Domain of unknown function (DU1801)
MNRGATTVAEYLAGLDDATRSALQAVRKVVNANIPSGFKEGLLFGMIGWAIPLSVFPDTYNGQPLGIVALAAQKNHLALYLMGVYGDVAVKRWFEAAYKKSGKRLDMGKSCLRFKQASDLPLDVIAEVVARVSPDALIAAHEAAHAGKRKPGPKAQKAKKAPKKK